MVSPSFVCFFLTELADLPRYELQLSKETHATRASRHNLILDGQVHYAFHILCSFVCIRPNG